MINQIKNLIKKYREIIVYGIVGGTTTLVNIGVFALLTKVFQISWPQSILSEIAVAISILYAYYPNKKFVFRSKVSGFKDVSVEAGKFIGGRIVTNLIDPLIMLIAVDWLNGNGMVWKVITTILMIIINYLIGKFIVFRKGAKIEGEKKDNSIKNNSEEE